MAEQEHQIQPPTTTQDTLQQDFLSMVAQTSEQVPGDKITPIGNVPFEMPRRRTVRDQVGKLFERAKAIGQNMAELLREDWLHE